jgi:hypothetical protein
VIVFGAGGPVTGPVWDFWTESEPCSDPPQAPSSPAPGDGATGVSVDADLSWTGGHPCPGQGVRYDVYLEAGDDSPDQIVCKDGTNDCTLDRLSHGTRYYWQVVAKGANGPTVGPVWEFQTEPEPCDDPPRTPYKPSPADGTQNVPLSPELGWSGGHPCQGETASYDVYLAKALRGLLGGFVSRQWVLVCDDVTAARCQPTLDPSTQYEWKVVANGANGPAVGPVWDFKTGLPPCDDPPLVPYNPDPPNGKRLVSKFADLDWSGGHSCAGATVRYDVYIGFFGTEPDEIICSNTTASDCWLPVLPPLNTIKWKVVAKGLNGPTNGPVWWFRTRP